MDNEYNIAYNIFNEGLHYGIDTMFSSFGLHESLKKYNNIVDKKIVKRLNPRFNTKLKDWSIKNRALKYVIDNYIMYGHLSHQLNFCAERGRNIVSVWNLKSKNIVCTIKNKDNKTFIRYRNNSNYRNLMASYNAEELNGNKIISVPSNNLSKQRNDTIHVLDRNIKDDFRIICADKKGVTKNGVLF